MGLRRGRGPRGEARRDSPVVLLPCASALLPRLPADRGPCVVRHCTYNSNGVIKKDTLRLIGTHWHLPNECASSLLSPALFVSQLDRLERWCGGPDPSLCALYEFRAAAYLLAQKIIVRSPLFLLVTHPSARHINSHGGPRRCGIGTNGCDRDYGYRRFCNFRQ